MPLKAIIVLFICAASIAENRESQKAYFPSEKYCDPSALLQLDDGEMGLLGNDEKGGLTLVPQKTKLKCTPDGRLITRTPSKSGEKPIAKVPIDVFPEVPKTIQQLEAHPELAAPKPKIANLESMKPEPAPEKARQQAAPPKPKKKHEAPPSKQKAEAPPLLAQAPMTPPPATETRVVALRRVTQVVPGARLPEAAEDLDRHDLPRAVSDFWPGRLPRQMASFAPFPPVAPRDIEDARPAPSRKTRAIDDAAGSLEMSVSPSEVLVAVPKDADKTAKAAAKAASTPSVPVVVVPRAAPAGPDVAVILSGNQFFPAKIRLRESERSRLLFTNLNRKPGALIIEKMNVQRWIANEDKGEQARRSARMEIEREIGRTKVTEVALKPPRGVYTFHDAVSGASGEITVE